jgi:hypothetical protein
MAKKRKRHAPLARRGADLPQFSELEEAFFASAPPEASPSLPETDRFDDLLAPPLARREWLPVWRRLMAAVRATWFRELTPRTASRQ